MASISLTCLRAAFLLERQKKLLVFENKFHRAFSYKNCSGCAIRKLHLAVLVAICKLQLAVRKKALKKLRIKMLMKSTPAGHASFVIYVYSNNCKNLCRIFLCHDKKQMWKNICFMPLVLFTLSNCDIEKVSFKFEKIRARVKQRRYFPLLSVYIKR